MLELSKIVTHEVWYDYIKTKYGENIAIMLHVYRQLYSLR